MKTALAVVSTQPGPVERSSKQSLYHAHLDFDGTCKGYERHMRRGSAARSVYGYLVAILKKHPSPLGYVFPSKRRIQERTFKWFRVNRKRWVMSDENYSRRQIYSALSLLTKIDAITPSKNGWLIKKHEAWAQPVNGICCVRHLETLLREKMRRKGIPIGDSSVLLAPVFPKDARTRVTVIEDVIQRNRRNCA